jgi:hypothetical protein
MGQFSSIPVRENGQKFFHTWFNSLRTAGIAVEGFFGTSFLTETTFTLANNQGAASNVTGLSFDSTSVKSAMIYCEVRRKTDSNEVISNGVLRVYYRDLTTTWELLNELGGDDDGVVFSITAAGQVQYTSSDLAGTSYTGKLTFKAVTFSA